MKTPSSRSIGLLAAATLLQVGLLSGTETPEPTADELRAALKDGELGDVERRCRARLEELEGQQKVEPLEVARVLDVLVESLWRSGKSQRDETWDFARRALEIKEETLGSHHAELAPSLDNLAHLFLSAGEYAEAKPLFEQGLRLREGSLGPDHPDVAHSLNQLGWVLYSTGNLDEGKRSCERSVAIRERTVGEVPELASSLNNLAIILKTEGDYAAAKSLYERALEIYERAYGSDHPQVTWTLNNLAILLKHQGDYAAAVPLYERSIRSGKRVLGPNHPAVAHTMSNLAALYTRMGDVATAERLQRQALEALEEAVNPNGPAVAQVLNNLGGLLLDAGETERAEPLLERALELREQAFGPDSPLVARVLNNLGDLHVRAGDLETATRFYDRSLAIVEPHLGPDHPETANVLEKLGDVLHREAEYEASRARFERALAIYEQSLGSEHPAVAGCLRALALVSLDTGDAAVALDLALRADEIGREHLLLTARTLPERQALAYALVRPAGQDLAYSVLAKQKEIGAIAASRVWNASIRSRALVLDEMRSRHRVLSQAEEPARRLARASERLANLLVRGPGNGSIEQYRRLVLGAREDRDRAERALAEASLSFRRTKEATQYGFPEVAAALPERSALIAFVRYERRLAAQIVPSYMAMVLRGEGGPAAISLGSEEDIEPLVARWREEIAAARNRSPLLGGTDDERYREVSGRLRRVVWDPVAKHVAKSERVFVVPDGVLQIVNLATLTDANNAYLIESAPPFHYLSTERDLASARGRPAPGRGLLVAGGAVFGLAQPPSASENRAGCDDLDSLRFSPLPGTVREIDAIASLWSSKTPEGPEARISRLEGLRATEDAFKRRSPGHRVLHLATHGFFVEERCETPSTGSLGSAEGTIRSLAPHARDEPAVLSGLALAGANLRHRPDPEGSDGILTEHEIASIDLTGVDWVVLSACDTGLGAIRAGEGVFGLRRAFQIAGAETLVMSLWSVEDASNRAWMRRLYEARLGGLGSAEAVHRAGLGVLLSRRRDRQSTNPFYWGAFVAVGGS